MVWCIALPGLFPSRLNAICYATGFLERYPHWTDTPVEDWHRRARSSEMKQLAKTYGCGAFVGRDRVFRIEFARGGPGWNG